MASRKSNVILTIEQRQTIIGQLESGVAVSTIAAMYNVHPITVRRIRQDAARINRLVDNHEKHKKIKRFKKPVYEDLEHKLYTWFVERRAVGVIITDALLMEKAAEFAKSLQIPTFRASRGWGTNFKKRHNIRLLKLHGEKESADENAASIFIEDFKTLMEEEDIDLANVYNMDETGLVWKALPKKTLAEDKQKCGGSKLKKDRVTVGLCANVLGTHKLVPLFIHKYKSPRALKNINTQLPIVFKSQKNAWITKNIFEEWFTNHFKPSVKAFQLQNHLCGKVILLVDNCAGHQLQENISEDDHFKIMFLPPNTTSILQPMDQGIIEKLKRSFRHKMLQHVLTFDGSVSEFYKNYNIRHCIEHLSEAWESVTPANIRHAWNQLLGDNKEAEDAYDRAELRELISIISGGCVSEQEYLRECEEEERRVTGDEESETDNIQNRDESNDSDKGNNKGQEEARLSGPTKQELEELKYIHERLKHLCATDPPHIREMYEVLRRYHFGEYDKGTTQRRELGHSSHQ